MGLMFPIYFLSFVISAGLALCSFYKIIELSDLDCDYTNPQRCSANLNKLYIPEMLSLGFLLGIHAVTANWFYVATILPMLCWLIYSNRSAPSGYQSLHDPMRISDKKFLRRLAKESVYKLVFYVVHVLVFMYSALITLQLK